MLETLKGMTWGHFWESSLIRNPSLKHPGRYDISPTMNLITGVTKGNGEKGKGQRERKKLDTQQLQSGALLPSADLKH